MSAKSALAKDTLWILPLSASNLHRSSPCLSLLQTIMARPDQNQILRRLPIVVGALGGTLLFINRVTTPGLSESQSRSDALGVILSAILILTGLLWQRIQPKSPEVVELEGEQGFDLDPDLPETLQTELAWASHLLLTNTATRSLVVYYDSKVLLRRGVFGSSKILSPGTIVQRVLKTQKPIYLVNLSIYPGRIEFDYLPKNTQGVICQPLGSHGVLILGANAPRSYTQQDEAWVAGIADKLADSLSSLRPAPAPQS
ncbi:MAG: cofactor assembly of complex C subunit B [Phormidesmis sp.]